MIGADFDAISEYVSIAGQKQIFSENLFLFWNKKVVILNLNTETSYSIDKNKHLMFSKFLIILLNPKKNRCFGFDFPFFCEKFQLN